MGQLGIIWEGKGKISICGRRESKLIGFCRPFLSLGHGENKILAYKRNILL